MSNHKDRDTRWPVIFQPFCLHTHKAPGTHTINTGFKGTPVRATVVTCYLVVKQIVQNLWHILGGFLNLKKKVIKIKGKYRKFYIRLTRKEN